MAKTKVDFGRVLHACKPVVKDMGLDIVFTHNLDPYFKGDLDGKTIFIGGHLSSEEKLFNLLHLSGHSIQWNIDRLLRELGSELYLNPTDEMLLQLQTYEWQANCYALTILHKAGIFILDAWLNDKYILDMMFLTHFYKTGEKLKRITSIAKSYPFNRKLEPCDIPAFEATAAKRTRNGLVIAFE